MKRILIWIICLLFLMGCQPTPAEEPVTNRTDGTLESAVCAAPVDPYTYEAPARWEETIFMRGHEIRVAADIQLPDAQQYPVTTIRQRTFSAIDIVSFLQSFCPGDWSIRDGEYSMDELMTDLQNVSKGVFVDIDEETGEWIWEPYEGQQEEMERLQALIEKTPQEDTYVPLQEDRLSIPLKRQRLKDSTGMTWYLSGKNSLITVDRYRDGNIQMENWVMQGDATPGEKGHALENIRITEAEAVQKGDAIIAALGLTDFRAADIKKAREVQSYTYAVYGEGYWLTYVPALSGAVPCFYGNYSDPDFLDFTQSSTTYAPGWQQENVQMFITEEGVLFLGWAAPKENILTANANVQLLPFDEIQKSIQKLLDYGLEGGEGPAIFIKRLVLTTSIAQIPNQGDEAFLVPTWAVFMTTELNERENMDMGVLLINALDGTYINRFGI